MDEAEATLDGVGAAEDGVKAMWVEGAGATEDGVGARWVEGVGATEDGVGVTEFCAVARW